MEKEGIRLNKSQFEKLNQCNLLELGKQYKGVQYDDISENQRAYFEGDAFNCLQLNEMFKNYLEILLTPDDKVWGLNGEVTDYIGRSSGMFSEAQAMFRPKD